MRTCFAITCCGLLLVPGSAATQQKQGVELKVVNYEGLTKVVREQRGKVVLVDFWGEF